LIDASIGLATLGIEVPPYIEVARDAGEGDVVIGVYASLAESEWDANAAADRSVRT